MQEQHAVGQQKVSVTITRKTDDDLIVSNHSSERWYRSEEAAIKAMGRVLQIFIEPEASGKADGDAEVHGLVEEPITPRGG